MSGLSDATNAFAAQLNPSSSRPSGRPEPSSEVEQLGGAFDETELAGGDGDDIEDELDQDEADVEGAEDKLNGEGDGEEDSDVEDDKGDEGDDEEDESGEGDEEAEDGKELLGKQVEVTIDGQPAKVSVKEALEGYIRTQTFHKRMNEVTDLKKNVEAEASDVAKARDIYGNMLSALKEQLDSLTPEEPDWDKLYASDPISASRQQHEWNKFKQQRTAIEQERVRVAEEQRKEQFKSLQKYAETERSRMLDKHPEWKDPKGWDKDKTSMSRTAKTAGFTDQEIAQIYDSRYMEVLLKASKYDRMMANKPKPVQNGPKTLKPGAGASRTAPKGTSRASSRLAKTGSVRDAINVFSGILSGER